MGGAIIAGHHTNKLSMVSSQDNELVVDNQNALMSARGASALIGAARFVVGLQPMTKKLFEALQHLKHNKHEVILFHTLDYEKEVDFDFSNKPQRFIDVETGKHIDLYAENAQVNYKEGMGNFINDLKLQCLQYRIKYVPVDIKKDINQLLTQFLVERQQFA